MRQITLVVMFTLLLTGAGVAVEVQPLQATGTTVARPAVTAIDRQMLDDQVKLSRVYSVKTRNTLQNTSRQFMLRVTTLPPKTTPLDAAKSGLSAAFPAGTPQSDMDAYLFWLLLEAARGAQQDYDSLLAQKNLADSVLQQATALLARVRERLGKDKPSRPHERPPRHRPKTLFTKNLHFQYAAAPVLTYTAQDVAKASAQQLLDMESNLESVGDDAQLASVDLQNTLQKQQQLIQLLSNAAKTTHDTATAIIRKIGG